MCFLVTRSEHMNLKSHIDFNSKLKSFDYVSSPCSIIVNEVRLLRTSRHDCKEQIESNYREENNPEFIFNGDTITHDDIVRQQYNSLPYPAISKTEITNSQNHYNSEFRHIPYMRTVAENLESLNHFLFKGENNFE